MQVGFVPLGGAVEIQGAEDGIKRSSNIYHKMLRGPDLDDPNHKVIAGGKVLRSEPNQGSDAGDLLVSLTFGSHIRYFGRVAAEEGHQRLVVDLPVNSRIVGDPNQGSICY